jgi:hypothetical protein
MPQNNISKSPLSSLGYGFVTKEHLPKGKSEYYLRDMQNRSGINYRQLTAYEIEVLVRNRNTSDNWNNILVSDAFNPELVKNCKFYGLVRIGKLESYCLEFSDLKVPVGLYNSTIISTDFGDNVCIDNVNYLSHYIIGNEVIIVNVNELATTNHAKFGNGIVKTGEDESIRIWLELCNENGGRKVLPFNGMLTADAFLWSKYRDDATLLNKFKQFTEKQFPAQRGYYGKVGHRTVIKNTAIIKDVWIGQDAYIKGANKLKNLTINSGDEGKTQIGEGCELVNGIVDYGCRIFYGVKAVRFVMASHSQLKYGARLINSYLGNNATISCCEVLNSLIYPAHEQHHNNSFLCAALVMGQSNIAAGATIGSNHNSRAADGEIIAGRGFWPGLCVSLKHNSKFASYTILAKGDYMYELNIQLPFSLVTVDYAKDQINIIPAYWFMYNMYALERNNQKYIDRDKRVERKINIEYNYLAPDTANEILQALDIIETAVGKAFVKHNASKAGNYKQLGATLLQEKNTIINSLEVVVDNFENSNRKVVLLKVLKAYTVYKNMLTKYLADSLIQADKQDKIKTKATLEKLISTNLSATEWINVGGQLMTQHQLNSLKADIKKGKLQSWAEVHHFYEQQANNYALDKLLHAIYAYCKANAIQQQAFNLNIIKSTLNQSITLQEQISQEIYITREKDYTNAFRKMVYDTTKEMNLVLGPLQENAFIKQQPNIVQAYKKSVNTFIKKYGL